MDITLIIGISGAVIVLVFFLLNQIHKISSDSLLYDGANFVGGLLLVVYAVSVSSLPFIVLNTIWALFSLRDFLKEFKRKYRSSRK